MSPVNVDLRVRPAFGRCVLSLNSGMAALDDQFAGKVLMVTINGDRPPVSPDDLVKALGIAHGIQISDLLVEVCPPPADFFVRFRTTFDCSRVFESSRRYNTRDISGKAPVRKPHAGFFGARVHGSDAP